MLERVQKILGRAGVDSRRRSEELILHGHVTVNGKLIKLGDKADSAKDIIRVDGEKIVIKKPLYLLFNKPRGCVCAVSDSRYRTVLDYVREEVFPVGRLDKDTDGLILLTNDGDFANRVIHPRFGVDRVYVATVDRPFKAADILRRGIMLDGRMVIPKYVKVFNVKSVELCIHSGVKHVVRRIFNYLGYNVVMLRRTRLGRLTLGSVKPGRFRWLSKEEVAYFNV